MNKAALVGIIFGFVMGLPPFHNNQPFRYCTHGQIWMSTPPCEECTDGSTADSCEKYGLKKRSG